jgi:tungstate transport system ATP-binding protein
MPAYRLDHVVCSYGSRPVLSIDRLEISRGKITALIGPNGAGKSTLLELLAFLRQPEGGSMTFLSQPVKGRRLIALRRRVGWVAQHPYLLAGTVQENVELGLRLHGFSSSEQRIRAERALQRVELAALAGRPARRLSGGEAQKTALARALAPEPDVLLFDEPFTYLDQASLVTVQGLMVDYAKDAEKTVVFSTHDQLHGLALADEVVSLIDGKPVHTPLINLFRGRVRHGHFETGAISIHLPNGVVQGQHASVDPTEIVLSAHPLASSIRNRFQGRVVAIAEECGRVRITVQAGETFHALITGESLNELGLHLGKHVWVNFKATAIKVF